MLALVCSVILVALTAGRGGQALHAINHRCKETPLTSKKVADAMTTCQESVKANIIEEAFTIIRYQWDHAEHEQEHPQLSHQPHPQTTSSIHQQHQHHSSHQPQHFARPPPGLGSDLLRHVHHIHRLPGQLHQHHAAYPPLNAVAAALGAGIDPRHPYHHQRPMLAGGGGDQPALNANSYFEYQHFDPDVHSRRRSEEASDDADEHGASIGGDDDGGDRRRRAAWPFLGGKTTEISMQEKRIAGCLLHCVFSKNHAVDGMGWPTLDGLVSFFSEGVHDHNYFVGTLRAASGCLNTLSNTYHMKRWRSPEHGQSCDLSFDVFNCISDKLVEYCENRPHLYQKH